MAPSTPNAEEKTERSIWVHGEGGGVNGAASSRVRAPYLARLRAREKYISRQSPGLALSCP